MNLNEKNRFAILAYSDTSDGDGDGDVNDEKTIVPKLKNIVRPRYTIQIGSQPIKFEANDPLPYNLNANSHSSFYNKCFFCQYMAHSQKHCPLKQFINSYN